MALLSSNGPLDTVSAVLCLVFSSCWFLSYGLGVEAVSKQMPQLLTFFGMLETKGLDMGGAGFAAVGGGAFAFMNAMHILPFFLGTEGAGGKKTRQTLELYSWLGFLLGHAKFAYDGNAGGLKSTFNLTWISCNVLMVALHWSWVGGDVKHKLKLT